MKSIVNAAPGLVNYGVKDESVAPYVRSQVPVPQHLPKYFIFAQKGPSTADKYPEQLLVGNERNLMYGDETFAEGSKYFNHQTRFANGVNAVGNSAMYVRVLGENYGPKPSIRLYADVLPTTIDQYERNADGSLKLDVAGDPIISAVSAKQGYRVKFVLEQVTDHAAAADFGTLDPKQGDQIDSVTGTQSTRYPILEQEHNFYGEDGNLAGIRLWAQTLENTGNLPVKMINRERAYPFNFGVVRKNAKTGTVKFQETIFGEQFFTVVFKEGTVDPLTNADLYFGDRNLSEYQNLTDTRYPLAYGEFGRTAVYQENIDTLVGLFHAAEAAAGLESWHDFSAASTEKYMFNFVTGTTTKGSPYKSFIFVDSADSVRFSANTNVFASGGSDGVMTNDTFANAVGDYMDRYADPDDELMDLAYHIESHIYDSGFPIDIKYKLIKFISERKDTFVHLVPYTDGERQLTPSEEYSIAQALRSRLVLYPESTYFGTPVYRAMVMGCTGLIRGSKSKTPVPVLYEIGVKSAKYMGAGNGVFKSDFSFEGYPGNVLDEMYDISITWVPDSVRVRNWDAGLNWVSRFDREQFQVQAMKTVYQEDSSILTSYVTACIFLAVNKALAKAQRVYSGRSDLTPAQLSERVNAFITAELRGRFDNRVTIIPQAQFTSMDEVRNYSWTVPVQVGADGMRTVMTAWAVARRRADLPAQ